MFDFLLQFFEETKHLNFKYDDFFGQWKFFYAIKVEKL